MHLAITDSGLGGLPVCAAVERALRTAGGPDARITYFNVWPDPNAGYNDLPDIAARARVFDRALSAIADASPDLIVIACNTLSIVYEATRFRRSPSMPVLGIIGVGVSLFADALETEPGASIVLFGTRSTIESGAHRQGLVARGIDARRVAAAPSHGLAAAIETDPSSQAVTDLIERYTAEAAQARPQGCPILLGICCTHFTYVAEQMRAALERHSGRKVRSLDPTDRLVSAVIASSAQLGADRPSGLQPATEPGITVRVVSKVTMSDAKRRALATRIAGVSPATAKALIAYTREPGLF